MYIANDRTVQYALPLKLAAVRLLRGRSYKHDYRECDKLDLIRAHVLSGHRGNLPMQTSSQWISVYMMLER